MNVSDLMQYGLPFVPLVAGLVELAKRSGLPAKFSPLVAVLLGMVAGVAYIAPANDATWSVGILAGVVVGLVTSGLYSSGKNLIEAARSEPDESGS